MNTYRTIFEYYKKNIIIYYFHYNQVLALSKLLFYECYNGNQYNNKLKIHYKNKQVY